MKNLDLVIEPYDALPCELKVFTINGQEASYDDFGVSEDTNTEDAEPYGCGCHQFIADKSLAEDTMKKYNITREEFDYICEQLEEKLYVGRCGWCI